MSGLFGAASASNPAPANTTGDVSKDVALTSPPEDSISDLSFCPTADILSVASWDNKLRIYDISENGQSQGKAMVEHSKPVLSTSFSSVRVVAICPMISLISG